MTTAPKSRPIIMTAESVRAILDGSKTMTRRQINPQPPAAFHDGRAFALSNGERFAFGRYGKTGKQEVWPPGNEPGIKCPFQVGMRLWVKETWWQYGSYECGMIDPYEADEKSDWRWNGWKPQGDFDLDRCRRFDAPPPELRSNRFIWRKMSPLYLPRWASRIELEVTDRYAELLHAITEADARAEGCANHVRFAERWEEINGNWRENCWVWVVSFERI